MSARRELERSGSTDPQVARQEARSADMLRRVSARVSSVEGNLFEGAQVLRDLALTTTPEKYNHGLRREWTGAIIIKTDGAGVLLATSSGTDAVWINLALDAGTATATVLVF